MQDACHPGPFGRGSPCAGGRGAGPVVEALTCRGASGPDRDIAVGVRRGVGYAPPHPEVPALFLLAACAEDPDVCAGEGDPRVEVGTLEGGTFVPYEDGDTIQILGQEGGYYVPLEYELQGIDPSGDVLVAIRFFWEGETASDDALANTLVNCVGEGPMTFATNVPIATDKQTASAMAAVDGGELRIDSTFTDEAGESISGSVTLVVDAP